MVFVFLTSFSVMISRSIPVAANSFTSFSLWLSSNPSHTHTPHLLYPFICQWTFRLFPTHTYLSTATLNANELNTPIKREKGRLDKKTRAYIKHILYEPTVVLLGIFPSELKSYVHAKTCAWMFIAALFIIAKTWKQARCLSGGG